jgi:hypothetical protein
LDDVAKVESAAKLDGRNMIMVLGPDKKKAKPKPAAESPKVEEIVQQEVAPSVSAEVSLEES